MNTNTIELLKVLEPIFFNIIIILIAIVVLHNANTITSYLKKSFSRNQRILLILTLLGLTLFVGIISPKQERILYDEDIYINNAQNIALFGRNEYCVNGEYIYGEYKCQEAIFNKQPPGHALTLSLPFRFFSVSRNTAFVFSNVVFLITASLIFFSVFEISKKFSLGLFAAALFALIPVIPTWHNTAASEPVAAMYITATLLGFLLYKNYKNLYAFFLGVLFFVLSFFTRYEALLLAIPIGYLLLRMIPNLKKISKTDIQKIGWIVILGVIAIAPIVLHYLNVRGDTWGADNQTMISTEHFVKNFNTNVQFFLENKEYPLFGLVLLFGIVISKRNFAVEYYGLAFLMLFGVYLFFYAGSYEYGADIRYAINSLSAFIILSAVGAHILMERFGERNVLLLILVPILLNATMLVPHMKYRGEEGWQALWDLEFIRDEIKPRIDRDDYVFTNTPYTYHIYGLNGRSTDTLYNPGEVSALITNQPDREYYFHFGYWCSLSPDPGTVAYFCENTALENYDLELIVEQDRMGTHFALYKIRGVKNTSPMN